jgi:hypothetical protein
MIYKLAECKELTSIVSGKIYIYNNNIIKSDFF